MNRDFKMVAKTLKGLEAVLADELRALGAKNVEPGRRMVAFEGDLEMLYKANLCCRTALRILKPFYSFTAFGTDELYEQIKAFEWGSLLTPAKTFSIDIVVNSDTFTHSRFATYRVKDAIADWFVDRYGPDKRPRVRLDDADVRINVHIQGNVVTLSLDSSGESLHKRGWREAQTEAPINEVLAAGILLLAGYDGSKPLLDPMCGSGTFLVEAAMIAANINPGVYRKNFSFEHWPDFDAELFERLWNDDSQEREVVHPIVGADISPAAVDIARRNLRAAGVARYVELQCKSLSQWGESPSGEGFIITNPPYGERIAAPDMDALYESIGDKLKRVFVGWDAWIIGYREEHFRKIGLAPSTKIALLNGSLECQLRQYIIFAGSKRDFRASGGKLKEIKEMDRGREADRRADRSRRSFDKGNRKPLGDKPFDKDRRKKNGDKSFAGRPFDKDLRKPLGGKNFGEDRSAKAESENPLALRRNPNALKSILGRKPSLPPSEGPIMRSRGWKKKD